MEKSATFLWKKIFLPNIFLIYMIVLKMYVLVK